MTRAQRNKKATEFTAWLRAIEKRYVGKIYAAIKTQVSSFSDELKYYGPAAARRLASQSTFSLVMTNVIRDMHLKSGLYLATKTYSSLQKEPVQRKYRTFGFNEQWTNEILQYFQLHLLESVESISATTRAYILSVMEQGINEGWSMDRMVEEINNKLYMRHRAERIVRTESTRAANYGTIIAADVYDYEVTKEWLAINDNRTRHSHRSVDEQIREMDQPYSNGLLFPGDPEGPAKEVVNCRCSQAIVPKRDAKGRLVPKNNNLSPALSRRMPAA